ncbi:hypothetical protein [Hydrogenophaga sp. PAMC20947]|uniref:hypothetical protein n=1 Tax=Hydrogenophaga sp. PAMC20947 TaxID=2565558 RepID=UPI0014454BB8|nr:hypothetical protein [Hydrogenophaga sp. PAMC20947]
MSSPSVDSADPATCGSSRFCAMAQRWHFYADLHVGDCLIETAAGLAVVMLVTGVWLF